MVGGKLGKRGKSILIDLSDVGDKVASQNPGIKATFIGMYAIYRPILPREAPN
jgi:hypothetical protein